MRKSIKGGTEACAAELRRYFRLDEAKHSKRLTERMGLNLPELRYRDCVEVGTGGYDIASAA